MTWVRIFCCGLAMVWLAACAEEAGPALPDEAGLDPAALAAFQRHLDRISSGTLDCSRRSIAAAATVRGRIDADGLDDIFIDTRSLQCRSRRGQDVALTYFCGVSACAYLLLLSDGGRWQVVPGLSGNRLSLVEHYRETRIEIRETARGGSAGHDVWVREYAWRDGQLVRVRAWAEMAEPRDSSR
jgi:hypothetical protein